LHRGDELRARQRLYQPLDRASGIPRSRLDIFGKHALGLLDRVQAMAITDEWNEKLRCPKCGNTGLASLSLGDDSDIPTVHRVPDGFNVVAGQYSPDFQCTTCNIAVVP
jgi:hypothetical protein